MAYQRKDAFYARAKAEGYRSRAAYKLVELARRYQLVKRGDHVVDLGAWPGGWLQVAAELVGSARHRRRRGPRAHRPVRAGRVSTLVGDASTPAVLDQLRERCKGRVDVLLSDMAPKLSGIRDRDAARAAELAETAIAVAEQLVAPGGRLLMKAFTGAEGETLALARRVFASAKLTKPEASRKESAEMYLIATGQTRLASALGMKAEPTKDKRISKGVMSRPTFAFCKYLLSFASRRLSRRPLARSARRLRRGPTAVQTAIGVSFAYHCAHRLTHHLRSRRPPRVS